MTPEPDKPRRRAYIPAIGPRLVRLLWVLFAMFAVMGVNSVYLASVTVLEWQSGNTYQNYFYQYMFLGHLALGLLMVIPVVVFGVLHIRNAHDRPNRRAVRVGYALFATSLLLLGTGLLLTRFDFFELKDPRLRSAAYWIHAVAPLVVVWLFVLHRLAGKPIQWRIGAFWLAVAGAFALLMALLHTQDPRAWNRVGPASGEQYFFPSLARTSTGDFIPARALMMDQYCLECHADIHESWSHSAHKLSSFNNPAYLFSVRETRRVAMERDGDVQASRFCAGCHDPVPFFSGAFDDPDFDDVNHPTSQAGVTCTACHAITHINSPRGNSDFTIEEPAHYPFAYSQNSFLRWVNKQLVKAKPEFHKKTFLKPLHESPEFCGSCHKVHLPQELNDYKWLRGQNHYDTYHLSGVSGHGVASFYYPPKAVHNCQQCHMPLVGSDDFGADYRDDSGELKVHDHLFASANTAIPYLTGAPPEVIDAHREFEPDALRVDLFGIKEGGTIDGELIAPLRPRVPALEPGTSYLLETIIRTVKLGHHFTQGTSDSNEVWVEVRARIGDRLVGQSGGVDAEGAVDPWAYFVNTYMLDREGKRIDRRNAQDIFVPLYSHQIPPGAASVVHYGLDVPADAQGELTVDVRLLFRKFDTTYLRYFQEEDFDGNDLPVRVLSADRVVFPIASGPAPQQPGQPAREIPEWERWNDYGIALLLESSEPGRGELRQAEQAFGEVERLGRPEGPLHLGRVYLVEGRLADATAALQRASQFDPPAATWSVTWFTGLINKQNGFLDEAIANFESLVALDTEETRRREFDFSQDYRLLNELGQTLFERAKQERGDARRESRERLLEQARGWFERVLEIDPENLAAHYNLALLYTQLGETDLAETHRDLHARYKPDDNARDLAIGRARREDPAANHAAEAVVIYDLDRPEGLVLEPIQTPE